MYRERRRSTEVSSLAPSPSAGTFATEDLRSVTSSHLPHRFVTSQNPEDVVASRYLQRLGNTFVRRASPDPAEKAALSGRTASFRARRAASRPASAVASSLAAVPAANSFAATPVQQQIPPLPSQQPPQQHARGEDGASATRRWRHQVGAPSDPLAATAPPNLSSMELASSSLTRSGQGSTGRAIGAAAAAGATGSSAAAAAASNMVLSPLAAGPHADAKRLGKLPLRRGLDGGSRPSSGRSASSSQSGSAQRSLSEARQSSFFEGDTTTTTTAAATFNAPATATRANARRGEVGRTPARGGPSQQRLVKRGTTNTYNEAALKANTAVSQAAALMSTGAPPPRKVRTEEERSAIVLAQEHAKLMLLVGRRANLEADIEDALELAESLEKRAMPLLRSTTTTAAITPVATASPPGNAAAVPSPPPPRKRGGSASSMADADTQLSIEAGAVRRRMRQLLTNLLGNGVLGSAGGATALDSQSLTRLVQQLQSQLDLVEDELTDRLEAEEDAMDELEASGSTTTFEASNRMRAVSSVSTAMAAAAASAGAAGAAGGQGTPPPALTLLQQRKQAHKKRQIDVREVSSNQERMEWLLESVDAELVTDVPAEARAAAATGFADTSPLDPLLPAALNGNMLDAANRRSILQAARHKHAAGASPGKGGDGLATILSLSPKPGQRAPSAESDLSSSYTRTLSQPSMVPFSLHDSVSDDGVTKVYGGSKQEPSQNESAAGAGLNLLGFMAEILAQYELSVEADSGKPRKKRRPLTAPSKNASLSSRPLPRRDGSTDSQDDDGGDGSGLDSDAESAAGRNGGGGSKRRNRASDAGLDGSGQLYKHSPPSPGGGYQGLRRPGSGAARNSAGKRQPLHFTEGGHNHDGTSASSAANGTGYNGPNGVGGGGGGPSLLGAELRNLRAGLLQDLHELRTLYDYMHLINERRRELSGGAGEKGEDDYEAELDRKLEEHRRQQQAAQRARDEAQRRRVEGEELDTFGQTGRKGGNATREKERPSQPSAQSPRHATPVKAAPHPSEPASPASLEEKAEAAKDAAEERDAVAAPPPVAPDGAAPFPSSTAAAAAATEVETELTRECIADGKLYFTLVGFSVPARTPATANGSTQGDDKTGGTKKRKGRLGSAGAGAESYLRYELRVERLDGARPSTVQASENAGNAAAPLVAVVKVNPRRLVNLKFTPADGVSVTTKNKVSVVTVAVERGAAPKSLFTLAPVKRYKASSFAKAFEYSSAATANTAEDDDDDDEGSRANSVASMPFTFPSPGDVSSRSASLDSAAVLADGQSPFAQSAASATDAALASETGLPGAMTSQGEAGSPQMSNPTISAGNSKGASLSTATKKGKSGPTGGKKTAARANEAAAKAKAGKTPPTVTASASLTTSGATAAAVGPDRGAKGGAAATTSLGSLPPLRKENAPMLASTSGGHPAEGTPLPKTPPLQERPRPVEEWGVPHPHAELEAVEKNAVVLTVLWAEEEELPWLAGETGAQGSTPPSSAGTKPGQKGGEAAAASTTDSPAAALLATIPNHDANSFDGDAAAVRPISGGMTSIGVAEAAKEGSRPQTGGTAGAESPAATAAAIDAVASELLRQVMEEDDAEFPEDGELHGGAKDAVLLSTGEQGTSQRLQHSADRTESAFEAAAQQTGHVEGGETGPDVNALTAGETSPPAARPDGDKQPQQAAPQSPASAGSPPLPPQHAIITPPPRTATRKPDTLASRTAEPPKSMMGTKAAPSLTISSATSRPMRAEEAHQYNGGLFRLDIAPEETERLRGTETSSSSPGKDEEKTSMGAAIGSAPSPSQRRASDPTSPADPLLHGKLPQPLATSSSAHHPSGAASTRGQSSSATHKGSSSNNNNAAASSATAANNAAENSVPFLPPVLVQQSGGGVKAHVLLPQEAVNSTLGPRVKGSVATASGSSDARPQSQSSNVQCRRTSGQAGRGDAAAASVNAAVSAQPALKEHFSVLPTTGPAAEAATDARTITHVQTFLQAVMRPQRGEAGKAGGPAGGKFAGGGVGSGFMRGSQPTATSNSSGGGMGALRSEVDELQDEARQLFMLDPVRYDAVVTELMQQATAELQREFAREQRRRSSASNQSTNSAGLGLPPVLVVAHGAQQAQNQPQHSVAGSSGLRPASKQASSNHPLHNSHSAEADDAHGVSPVSPADLSSAIPNPNARPTPRDNDGAGNMTGHNNNTNSGNTSAVFDATVGGSSADSQQGHSSPFALHGQDRLPSFVSPWTAGGARRSTHALVPQSGTTRSRFESSAATQRKSRADAVAEVERILYEQMKAKLLLRAIIEKMQALWQMKQRSVEERNRGRAARRMRRVVDRALAASWPIEKQRVINLRKLIYLLDRRVGRVHGWLPHYSDTNVLMTAPAGTMTSTVPSRSGAPSTMRAATTRTFVPLSTWYRGKGSAAAPGEGGSADGTSEEACPRYLRYLPQRRMHHYMRLAKSRRLMPLQLVRADVQECHSRHILLGYEKLAFDESEGGAASGQSSGPAHGGWPQRNLPLHARLAKQRRGNFVPDQYDDMQTRGERERYRRRLQGTAAFQGVSKMYSPRTRQDADLPHPLH